MYIPLLGNIYINIFGIENKFVIFIQTIVISTPTLWFGGDEDWGHTVWTVPKFIQTADSEAVGCIRGEPCHQSTLIYGEGSQAPAVWFCQSGKKTDNKTLKW